MAYFGLPGAEATDVVTWQHVLGRVSAVERTRKHYEQMQRFFDTRLAELTFRAHFGDLDKIILNNGDANGLVPTTYSEADEGYVWDFDVVYLDYCGKFLPVAQGPAAIERRANAIRQLFQPDRQDARQPWLLLLTAEARFQNATDRDRMRQYLDAARADAVEGNLPAYNHLLEDGLDEDEEAVRLIHGTVCHLVARGATGAGVRVKPRGGATYAGTKDIPMIHVAFEVLPTGNWTHLIDPLPLCQAPLLRVTDGPGSFELRPRQAPGQTRATARGCLDFLSPGVLDLVCPA